VFWKAVSTQDVTNPVTLPSISCLDEIPVLREETLLKMLYTN